MIIGNQANGRWMKRSPFENPYVLADQIGNWLTDWKAPPVGEDYANAPELRNISRGEQIFRTRCASCHSLTGDEPEDALGPDLIGVGQRRERAWLLDWLRAPDQMLARKDPIAMALYEKYDRLVMPNSRLNRAEALALLDYFDEETERLTGRTAQAGAVVPVSDAAPAPQGDVVAVMDAWVRETDPKAKVNAGYLTLINVGPEDVTLVAVESDAFAKVEVHEMAMSDGLMTMRELDGIVIPAGGQVRLEPGGKHLMLMGPRQPLTAGQSVNLTLTFGSGRTQALVVPVADK